MERKKASDFPQELLDEFHLYVHGDIDRRTFLDRAGKYAVGGLTAAARRGHSGHFGCACNSTHDLPRVTVVTDCHQVFRRGKPPPDARRK